MLNFQIFPNGREVKAQWSLLIQTFAVTSGYHKKEKHIMDRNIFRIHNMKFDFKSIDVVTSGSDLSRQVYDHFYAEKSKKLYAISMWIFQ